MFSNIDEGVRQLTRWPTGQWQCVGARKGAREVFSGGRHLGLRKVGGIDVPSAGASSSGRQRVAPATFRQVAPKRGVRGLASMEPLFADKAAALFPPRAKARTGWQSIGPKPAVRRQARGCRRLDDRKVVRRLPRRSRKREVSRRIWKANAGGFSHGARRTVSEGWVSAGARDAKRRL
jgi:hypothetical protein